MNQITTGKRMTVQEVAAALGCNPETIKHHIRELFPDLMQNGKTTYLHEKQVTIILESIKKSTAEHRGLESINLQWSVAGTETAQSRALRPAPSAN
jgi:predicted transcriptional regulator